MQNIDIKNIEITLHVPVILNALSSKHSFEIDIHGNVYVNETADILTPIVFRCDVYDGSEQIMDAVMIMKQLFKEYQPRISGSSCKIKPLIAWQSVIELNKDRMLYFDHQSDGVELFEDKELEDMGWEATALDISYRQITEHIEQHCDGFLVFYDNEISFNGFVIVNNIEQVRLSVKSFIIKKINEKIQEGLVDCDDYDIQEALEFFGVEI